MPEVRVMNMSAKHRLLIEQFAASDARHPYRKHLHDQAVEVYRQYAQTTPVEHWNRHMQYMAEIDKPSPDYALLLEYRAQLLARDNLPAIR